MGVGRPAPPRPSLASGRVIVTSRRRPGILEGAATVPLDLPPPTESVRGFGMVAGTVRAAAEHHCTQRTYPVPVRSPTAQQESQMPPEATYVPFTEEAAALVASWATSVEEVRFWCSATVAPVPAATVAGWGRADDVLARMLVLDGRPVAYGELWIDDDEREVELARLIVDAKRRGQRLGRTLVGHLASEARGHHPDVFLRLQPDNEVAEACYRAAGFVRMDAETEREWNSGQPSDYKWMRLPK